MKRSNQTPYEYVVEVQDVMAELGDEEPQLYGPWSRETAEKIAADVERRLGGDYIVTWWSLRRLTPAQIAAEWSKS